MEPPVKYPTKANIVRAAAAAREIGLDVAGIEIGADGSIKLMDARAMPVARPKSLFEDLESKGLI